MQQVKPDRQQGLHASINMYPENGEAFTAVCPTALARGANSAVDIRDRSRIGRRPDAFLVRSRSVRSVDHFAREFMSEHARISVGWMAAR